MPKKSTKSKSKRMTLKQKYKVIRKVKDHHRKKRKELKKLGIKPKEPKDPGIPSQWPFKDELLKELAWKKQQILLEEKEKKESKKRRREERAAEMETDEGADGGEHILQLAQQAAKRQADFETRKRARLGGDADGDTDRTRKAFYREFKAVAERSDVIIQVLDARDPMACRCPDIERYIRSLNPNKRIILLLNKIGCLGADTLLQLLKNYTRSLGIKTSITVGVVGLPNVGKSSLINSLKRARVAQVGNTPGVTKAVQEVHLDKNIKLLDSPGVVFSSGDNNAASMLRNCVKVENLPDPAAPVAEILKRVPAKTLMALYRIAAFADTDNFLQLVAAARGKLRRGGTPDSGAAARVVLQDWNNGVIPFYTLPPVRAATGLEGAEVVTQWAKEFNANEVFANEANAVIAHLPTADDDEREWVALEAGGQVQVDLAAMEQDDQAADAEEDEGDDMDDDGPVPPKALSEGSQQAKVLYSEAGQFNPAQARADKKRLKKLKAAGLTAVPQENEEAFDFDEANFVDKAEAVDDDEDDELEEGSDVEDGEEEEEGSDE